MKNCLRAILAPLLLCGSASAQLVITEINSNGTPADFWELTNYGAAVVDISGYIWDDDSANPNAGNAVTIPAGTSIGPKESIIFAVETTAAGFRSAWNLPPSVRVITSDNPGLGGNDAVHLFNASGQPVTSLDYSAGGFTRSNGGASLGGHAGESAGGEAHQSLVLDPAFGHGPGRRYTFATGSNHFTSAANSPNTGVGSPGRSGEAVSNPPPLFVTAPQTYWKAGLSLTTTPSPFRITAISQSPSSSVVLSFAGKPAWLNLVSAGPGSYRLTGNPPNPSVTTNYSVTIFATDSQDPTAQSMQRVTITLLAATSSILLNEYNAVESDEFLRGGDATQDADGVSPAPVDSHFGRVPGNGGQWVEFVVMGGGTAASAPVDMRGWTIDVVGNGPTRSIVLSQDPYWQSVIPGTILTFTVANSANGGLDTGIHRVSSRHTSGHVWTNVWIFDPHLVNQSASTFVTDLGIDSDDTRFAVRNAGGSILYGPSGEGIASVQGAPGDLLGVSSREVLRLQDNPAPGVDPLLGNYNDADNSSTFGAPNTWGGAPTVQSFAAYAAAATPPQFSSQPVVTAFGGYHYEIAATNPGGGSVDLTAPVLPDFLTLSGNVLSNNRPLVAADAGEYTVRLVAGSGGLSTPQIFTLTVFNDQPAVILNEYNAVAEEGFLNGGSASEDANGAATTDSHFGRVDGNGGSWFELVVVGDGGPSTVDMRGWSIEIANSGLHGFTPVNTLELSQHEYWSAVPAGTILTFIAGNSANGGLDTEINRRDRFATHGDRWTNVWMGDASLLVFTGAGENGYTISGGKVEGIAIDQNNTRFVLKNASGERVFGPAGEGVAPVAGISSTEIFQLKGNPSPSVTPLLDGTSGEVGYSDGIGSTFGFPNHWDAGTKVQDFTAFNGSSGGTSFGTWIAGFEFEDEADYGAAEDPDNDGRSNMEEYAFGGNPAEADASPFPQQIARDGGVTWSYLRRSDDSSLSYMHEFSVDLEEWNDVPEEEIQVNVEPHPSLEGYEITTVEISGLPGDKVFLRVMIP